MRDIARVEQISNSASLTETASSAQSLHRPSQELEVLTTHFRIA